MLIKNNNIYIIKANQHLKNANQLKNPNWSLFDKIYCIHYLPYKDRLQPIKNELERIGILNLPQFEFFYTTPNKYYDYLLFDRLNESTNIDFKQIYLRNLNLQLNRLNLLTIAKYSGFKRILILEDDNIFLKDLSLLADYLNNFPLNYDIVNMEWIFIPKEKEIEWRNTKFNDLDNKWFKSTGNFTNIFDASMISLNDVAIKYLIEQISTVLRPMDNYIFKRNDVSSNTKLKIALSTKHLCLQKMLSDRQDIFNTDKYLNVNGDEYGSN